MSARDYVRIGDDGPRDYVRIGDDGLSPGTILLADKADVINKLGSAMKSAASGRVTGRNDPTSSHVGSFLGFHTMEDGERARDQLASGFKALQDEVMHAAGYSADPYRAASGPIWDWWKIAGIPVITEWQKFQADQAGSHLSRMGAGWEVFESWQNRLGALRDQAKAHLGHLVSPEPAPLPQTTIDKIGDVAGGVAGAIGNVGRVALWAGLGLGSLWIGAKIYAAARGK